MRISSLVRGLSDRPEGGGRLLAAALRRSYLVVQFLFLSLLRHSLSNSPVVGLPDVTFWET
jgi:hypothetical protein